MVIVTKKKFPNFGLVKYQCLAAISANLIVFCHGTTIGWCAPSIWLMLTEHSPFSSGKVSLDDTSWIGSVLYLGSIIGSCFFALIWKHFSGKAAMTILALPNIAAWIIVLCADHPFHLIISRMLTGISSGAAILCVPLFIAEIAHKNIRGILGSLFMINASLGILFGLIIGSYVPFRLSPYILVIPALIYTCSAIILPETPQSLLMANKSQEAEKSFIFYNFGNKQEGEMTTDTKLEFEQLCSIVTRRMQDDNECNQVTFRTFLTGRTLKGILVGIFICALAMFSGIFCVNMYSISIFTETGTTVDPKVSAIIISLIQIIGSFVAGILVDRWGRKILLSLSCLGSALSFLGFASFVYLHHRNYVLTSYYWVPVTSMALFIFSCNAGIVPLPFIIIAESLPQETRRVGSTICSFVYSGFAFINVKFFPILSNYLGLHTVIWIYGGVCLLGSFFATFVLEETKGKAINN